MERSEIFRKLRTWIANKLKEDGILRLRWEKSLSPKCDECRKEVKRTWRLELHPTPRNKDEELLFETAKKYFLCDKCLEALGSPFIDSAVFEENMAKIELESSSVIEIADLIMKE